MQKCLDQCFDPVADRFLHQKFTGLSGSGTALLTLRYCYDVCECSLSKNKTQNYAKSIALDEYDVLKMGLDIQNGALGAENRRFKIV